MSDLNEKLALARQRLSLRTMMAQRQKDPTANKGICPYCGKKGAKLTEKGGRGWFKCFHTSCKSGTSGEKQSWDEVGFLAYELGLSRREALLTYLKEAGVPLDPPRRSSSRAPSSDYLPEEPGETIDLPPEADGSNPPPPPSIAGSPETDDGAGPLESKANYSGDGWSVAVPGVPPVADGATASPSATSGAPTPPLGEAVPLPATAGAPGETSAGSSTQDAVPPANLIEFPVQASAEPSEEEEDGKRVAPTVAAMRHLAGRIELLAEDLTTLRNKRGLLLRVIRELGFLSSCRANEAVLLGMGAEFPSHVLQAASLWTRGQRPSDSARPNRQYFGWGIVGRNPNPRGPADEFLWGWTPTVLIPYLNRAGELLDLRVHKRTQTGQAPRLYVPRPLAGLPGERIWPEPAFAVVTEGEYKAAGLYQQLRAQGIMAGLPGITMSKPLWGELVDWLLDELPAGRPVVVVYDNEDKGTPGLPGYKPEWRKRHDSEKWARYLARRLVKNGFPARVGLLPDGWRDGKGKADWDGVLGMFRTERP